MTSGETKGKVERPREERYINQSRKRADSIQEKCLWEETEDCGGFIIK
jgi:hypothetical protein